MKLAGEKQRRIDERIAWGAPFMIYIAIVAIAIFGFNASLPAMIGLMLLWVGFSIGQLYGYERGHKHGHERTVEALFMWHMDAETYEERIENARWN